MAERLRITTLVERSANPDLYDDLVACAKGRARSHRLKNLAYAGLLQQSNRVPARPVPELAVRRESSNSAIPGAEEAGIELFGPPIND